MSFEALAWASDIEGVPTTQKCLLVMLANYAGSDGTCFPSQDLLAKKVGCTVKTIQNTIPKLVEAGLITVEERRTPDGRQTSSLYTLLPSENASRSTPRVEELDENQSELLPGENDGQSENEAPNSENISPEPITEPPSTNSQHGSDENGGSFVERISDCTEQIWTVWPKGSRSRSSRTEIRNKLRIACEREKLQPEQIVEAARAWLAGQDMREDGRFVKGPAPWFNKAIYLDYLDVEAGAEEPEQSQSDERMGLYVSEGFWAPTWGEEPSDEEVEAFLARRRAAGVPETAEPPAQKELPASQGASTSAAPVTTGKPGSKKDGRPQLGPVSVPDLTPKAKPNEQGGDLRFEGHNIFGIVDQVNTAGMDIAVKLNGQLIADVLRASTDAGWVDAYVRGGDGKIQTKNGQPETTRQYGSVEVIKLG